MENISLKRNDTASLEEWQRFNVNGTDMALYQVFSLLKAEHGNKKAIQLTSEYCLLTDSEVNRRTGLEFLYAYGYLEKMETLIDKNLESADPVSQKWGLIYQVIHEWKIKKTTPAEYLSKIEKLDIMESELICLKNFIYVYAHYERKEFGKLGSHLDRLLEGIQKVDDPLLQEFFSIRLDELLMTYYWKRNEMIIARKHGYRILNRTYNECKKADVHNALALGFIYDSYEQAMYHGKQALLLAEKHECSSLIDEVANHTIPFIAAYFGRTDEITSDMLSEQAHLAMARGDKETSIQLLNQIDELTPFQQYYLGKVTGSRKLLEESHYRFINERSDYFFAKLPLLELNKLNTIQ